MVSHRSTAASSAWSLPTHSQTGSNTGHDERDQVVQIGIRRARDLQGVHADVVKRLVVDTVGLVRVLNQLVDGQGSVVRLNDGVRDLVALTPDCQPIPSSSKQHHHSTHLGRRHHREGAHHPVRELLPDLGDQKRTHTRSSTSSQRVGDLESLETVGTLSLLSDDIENLVDELGSFGVVTLSPVVLRDETKAISDETKNIA